MKGEIFILPPVYGQRNEKGGGMVGAPGPSRVFFQEFDLLSLKLSCLSLLCYKKALYVSTYQSIFYRAKKTYLS